jgi:hypothetical protein
MKKTCTVVLVAALLNPAWLSAADGGPVTWRRATDIYREKAMPRVDLSNSALVHQLLRSGNIYLSLADAVTLAIENNLDVELERYSPLSANEELRRAKGGGTLRGLIYTLSETPTGVGGPASPLVTAAASSNFSAGAVPTNPSELGVLAEPQDNLSVLSTVPQTTGPAIPLFDAALGAQINSTHQTTPEPQNNFGTPALQTNITNANFGYAQGFGPGTLLNVGFNNTRESINSLQTTISPFVSSSFGFTVTQPLLRGFGLSVNRRFIRIARNEQRIADELLRQQLIATVYGVTRLYTDLVALYEDVKVKESTLASAEQLYSNTQAQVQEGTQAPIELTRANAQVYSLRQDLINSRGLLEEQEAIVKNVITRRTSDDVALLSAGVIPTDTIDVPVSDNILPRSAWRDRAMRCYLKSISSPPPKTAAWQVRRTRCR